MPGRFAARVVAVYGVGFNFFVMAVSGLILLVAPQGRLAQSIDWRLLGLPREGWEAVHNTTAFAFIGFALWHIVVHWSVIRNFLIGAKGHPASHRSEAAFVLIFIGLLLVTAILDLPPASWLTDLNGYFKREFWGAAL